MSALLSVMAGGALGAGARYLVGLLIVARLGNGFPIATLAINLLGGLLMGLLVGALARFGQNGEPWRLLLGVGVLGGFTTFSAFSLECWTLIERGAYAAAFVYIAASVLGGVALLVAGVALGKGFV